MPNRPLTFTQAINEAIEIGMAKDPLAICFGLGVDDPKGVFGTTLGLQEKFGRERVFDMPTSENGMTGVAIGAALNGVRSVVTHQRLDFFLLAMDQLVNNAAKWHYMFGGNASVPITIRLILGRGWGQGPTHSQSLHAWFSHIPGLKVVVPTTPEDAKGLLLASLFDPNPVVFLEHRWLHNQVGEVPAGYYETELGEAKLFRSGNDVTVVSMSYQTLEALRVLNGLQKQGVGCDLIDLRSVNPIDWKTIFESVRKTGRLVVLDMASAQCSVGSEIISKVAQECFSALKVAPELVAFPNVPSPTTPALTQYYYPGAREIVESLSRVMGRKLSSVGLERSGPHDVPGDWFKGPF